MKYLNSNVFAETVKIFPPSYKMHHLEFAYVIDKTRTGKRVPGGVVGWPECRSLPHMPAWQRMYCNNLARHPEL